MLLTKKLGGCLQAFKHRLPVAGFKFLQTLISFVSDFIAV
jgi:hypothetical protein